MTDYICPDCGHEQNKHSDTCCNMVIFDKAGACHYCGCMRSSDWIEAILERDDARAWARRYYALYQRARIETHLDIQEQNKLRKELARSTRDATFVTLELQKDCKRLRDERNYARLQIIKSGYNGANREYFILIPFLDDIHSEWCPHCGGNRFVDSMTGDIRCQDCLVVEKNE